MTRAGLRVLLAATLFATGWAPARAQTLQARIGSAPDGDLVFHYDARAGVCGDGDVVVRQRPGNGNSVSFVGNLSSRDGRDFDHLDTWCHPGPVYVTVVRAGRDVHALHLSVGETLSREAFDLGAVPADDAVAYLVGELARTGDRKLASRALHAASLAAAEAWRPMLALAHDESVEEKVRTNALHWLAVDASDRLLEGQPPIDDATELRRQAVFALSRRTDERSRTAIRDLTRAGTEPAIRAAAVYWLGVSDELDALPLLESVLRSGG